MMVKVSLPDKQEQNDVETILELDRVRFGGTDETSIRLNDVSGQLGAGELLLLTLNSRQDSRDIVSLLLGLASPDAGTVRFLGQDWLGNDYSRHFQMRRRIGRVFDGTAWIQNLTVGENIRLSQLHHGSPLREVQKSIDEWLPRLSGTRVKEVRACLRRRPAFVDVSILQICQFVRAVFSNPRLLILERPLHYMLDELYRDLVSVIDDLRLHGTAVLWFAGGREDNQLKFKSPIRTWSVQDDVLKTHEGTPDHE